MAIIPNVNADLSSDLPGIGNYTDLYNEKFGSSESSASDISSEVPDYDNLYMINRDWAEEQAQKQMDFQTSANKIAMDFAAEQADKERAFQTEMANSAWQRAVEDMKKAGLNPILAYSQGGAAVPSVNSASGVTSVGSKASMSDTGYNAAELDYAYTKMVVNAATDILGDILNFASKGKSTTVNHYLAGNK